MKCSHSKISFFFLSVFGLFSCAGSGLIAPQIDLPENPDKIIIEWYEGGGMEPESECIYLSVDSSYWSHWRSPGEQKVYFNTSTEELKKLYQTLVEFNFANIRLIEEHEVYDRGGTSIRLQADGKFYDKNNSGMTFIHQSDVDNYFEIETAIYDFAKNKTALLKKSFELVIAENLLRSKYKFNLMINGQSVLYVKDSIYPGLIDTLLYPGFNEFTFGIYDSDTVDYYGYPTRIQEISAVRFVSDSISKIKFSMKSGTIIAE
ncbi:MAG: hypothetical protein IPM74_07140 [Crocinitomicaceae bacterium]|nr:hypothetical protein [Crocinitomicaceae bacterium]MBK8925674.1 hypothetical protein [Crocinitomicaceae bacterium]